MPCQLRTVLLSNNVVASYKMLPSYERLRMYAKSWPKFLQCNESRRENFAV